MMLGKRQRRPPMSRTTSMTEFTLDLSNTTISVVDGGGGGGGAYPQQFDPHNPFLTTPRITKPAEIQQQNSFLAAAAASRPIGRRHSADFTLTADDHFLRACTLCKRSLIPGRDIFMYRGDSAFCSLECRQQQVNQDERKEKCSLASKMEVSTTATGSDVSSTAETVAAV